MPREGRRDHSGGRAHIPTPGPPPPINPKKWTQCETRTQLSLKQFGGRTELEKRHFLFYGFGKTFSLLLVSHRETNAKGQPYKPPATPLPLTKIFEEDGVGFWEGKGKRSLESFPFPSPMLPITPQPSRPWRAPRRRRPLEGRRGRRRTRRRLWPRPRWSRP